jgi:hypothetical protein
MRSTRTHSRPCSTPQMMRQPPARSLQPGCPASCLTLAAPNGSRAGSSVFDATRHAATLAAILVDADDAALESTRPDTRQTLPVAASGPALQALLQAHPQTLEQMEWP